MNDTEQAPPGLEPAQAYIIPSYQIMVTRLESADTRLHTMVAFAATVALAIPAAAKNLVANISFTSWWFIAAMLTAVCVVGIGTYVRSYGKGVQVMNPRVLYDRWRELPKVQFQSDALYFAGKHFDENAAEVTRKANAAAALSMLFVLQVALLLGWIANAD